MDNIDATSRSVPVSNAPPPSLLIVIIDTSPPIWAHLKDSLPLSSVIKTLLIFLNAHLALNHANKVAVLASHVKSVQWLYPTPPGEDLRRNGTSEAENLTSTSKYRPFGLVEHEVRKNLEKLLFETPSSATISSPPVLSAAISNALTYANMQNLLSIPTNNSASSNLEAGISDLDSHTNALRSAAAAPQLSTRILVFSVYPEDLSGQYIALMNGCFAAQRLGIPIDMIRIGESGAFLQQASDATHGIFMTYDPDAKSSEPTNGESMPKAHNSEEVEMGLLQTLLMGYLPDVTARKHLIPTGSAEVDFRAACFCHGKVVSLGGVCSVCLSIFCIPLPPEIANCPTCQSKLRIPKAMTAQPIVLARKKKKKRKGDGDAVASDTGTPLSGTPMR